MCRKRIKKEADPIIWYLVCQTSEAKKYHFKNVFVLIKELVYFQIFEAPKIDIFFV